MKKLMIALSAATLVALGAKADPVTLQGGMDFENYTVGDPISAAADPGSKSKLIFWGSASDDSKVAGDASNKYLAVDTTETLIRQTAGVDATAVGPVDIPEGGDITISTKVQFTAADDAPTAAEGDKLLVWAKAPADGADSQDIKLMVTDKSGARETDTVVTVDTWYNLEIVAVATGKEDTASASFTVKIAEAGEELATVTIDGEDATFVSCVDEGDAAAQTISSIGFKGTGAVDDIGFEATTGVKPVDIEVTIAGNAVDDYGVQFGKDEYSKPVAMKSGEKVTLLVFANEGDTVESTKGTPTWSDDDTAWKIEYTLAPEDAGEEGALTITITVTPGGETSPIVPTIDPEGATVEGIPEGGFVVGTEYTVADITATPSEAHKRATVVIKINGEAVEGETFTLEAGDEVTIEVTEEDIKVNVTVDAAEGTTVAGVTAGQVVEGSTLTFTVSVAEGYKADTLVVKNGETTLEAVEGTYTVVADADVAITTTVDALATVNVTVVEFGTKVSTLGATATEGDTLTFTVSVDDDYAAESLVVKANGTKLTAVEGTYTVTVGTADIEISAVADKKGGTWPADWNVPATATAEQFAAFTEWAKTNDASATNAKEAFLMGVNLDEKFEPLAATSIAIVEGKVVITTNAGATPNGVIYVKYGDTVECDDGVAAIDADLDTTDKPAQFFKVCIDFVMPPEE